MSWIRHSINTKNEEATISELEAFMIAIDKLLSDRIRDNPKSGIKIAKGQKNEVRLKYKKANSILIDLYTYFAEKGTFSMGVCATCDNFKVCSSNKCFGNCGSKTVHKYDTCNNHSKEGSGYGKGRK